MRQTQKMRQRQLQHEYQVHQDGRRKNTVVTGIMHLVSSMPRRFRRAQLLPQLCSPCRCLSFEPSSRVILGGA